MSNYDLIVSDAKRDALRAVIRLNENDKSGKPVCDGWNANDVANTIDNLNKAWDALTDALVRQREEYQKQVERLIHELAEARKK